MIHLRLARNGHVHELTSPLPWEQVVEIVGRAFFPEATPTGPKLPPAEPAPRVRHGRKG